MRWEELFADLEAQLVAAEAAAEHAEVTDRSRREAAALTVVDRVRLSAGMHVQVRVEGGAAVEGEIREVGSQWLLVAERQGQEALIPLAAVVAVRGLGTLSGAPGSAGLVFERLGLGAALRGIARDRAAVSVTVSDGTTLAGTIDRVGADFIEVTAHAPGEPRRRAEVIAVVLVPFAALAVVRRSP